MAKKSYKTGDIIKISQIEKLNNTFVLVEFEKEMKLLSEAEKSEGKILYINETKTKEEENKAIVDINQITFNNEAKNYGIYYYPKSKENLKKMIDAISIPFAEMELNVQSPFGMIEKSKLWYYKMPEIKKEETV